MKSQVKRLQDEVTVLSSMLRELVSDKPPKQIDKETAKGMLKTFWPKKEAD
jgi:hypothetical protein